MLLDNKIGAKPSLTRSFRIVELCLLLVVIFIAVMRIWAIDKGFDITDEAYAVLGFEPLQERLEVFSAFHRIVNKLFGWLKPSLIAYRAMGQSLTVIAASFFACCFCYWRNRIYKPQEILFSFPFILLLFILGGFVLDYDRHNMLNYNVINNALNLTEAGLILVLVAQETEKVISSWYFKLGWLATGYLVAFQFLNKAPSSVMFVALLTVFLFLYQKDTNWRYYLTCGSCFVTGGILGLLTYFIFVQDFWEYQELLFRQLSLSSQNDFSSNTNLKEGFSIGKGNSGISRASRNRLLKGGKSFIAIQATIEIIVVSIFTHFISKNIFAYDTWKTSQKVNTGVEQAEETLAFPLVKLKYGLFCCFIVTVIALIVTPLRDILFKYLGLTLSLIQGSGITARYPLVFLFLLIILMNAFKIKSFYFIFNRGQNYFINNPHIRKIIATSLFLFLLPYCAAFGTNTSVLILAARNIIPWLALVIILLNSLFQIKKVRKFIQFLILAIIIWLVIRIYYFQVHTPYRLVENRWQQTETVNFLQPRARGLKVDLPTAEFYRKLNQIVKQTDFKPGDPIIALDTTPGLVYLLGGVSPGGPWYFRDEGSRTCNNILYSSFDSSKAILLISADISPQVLGCLKTVGINFPENYQKIGEVNNPWFIIHPVQGKIVTVWSPRK